jgi:hypothetical protein
MPPYPPRESPLPYQPQALTSGKATVLYQNAPLRILEIFYLPCKNVHASLPTQRVPPFLSTPGTYIRKGHRLAPECPHMLKNPIDLACKKVHAPLLPTQKAPPTLTSGKATVLHQNAPRVHRAPPKLCPVTTTLVGSSPAGNRSLIAARRGLVVLVPLRALLKAFKKPECTCRMGRKPHQEGLR